MIEIWLDGIVTDKSVMDSFDGQDLLSIRVLPYESVIGSNTDDLEYTVNFLGRNAKFASDNVIIGDVINLRGILYRANRAKTRATWLYILGEDIHLPLRVKRRTRQKTASQKRKTSIFDTLNDSTLSTKEKGKRLGMIARRGKRSRAEMEAKKTSEDIEVEEFFARRMKGNIQVEDEEEEVDEDE